MALLAGCPARAQHGAGLGGQPLPPALAALLPPAFPVSDAADVRRLQAARPRWASDSLSRLLVYSRLAHDYARLQLVGPHYRCLVQAWRMAGPAQRRRQPAEVLAVAKSLALYCYGQGAYDSTRYYFQQAIRLFRAAHLDSVRILKLTLPSTEVWTGGGTLAGILGNAGSASRALGNLPEALRYYEQARALWQQQRSYSGVSWLHCLIGETYAEQGQASQALLSYEQALRTARAQRREHLREGSEALANVLLSYYGPLLLTIPGKSAYLTQLATEAAQALQTNDSLYQPQRNPGVSRLLVRISLLPAQAALQAGHQATAAAWLARARRWLPRGAQSDTVAAQWRNLEYAEPLVSYLGLQAWYRHARNPASAGRLLDEAASLLTVGNQADPQRRPRQLLASFCLAMHEPRRASRLLRPLLRTYQQSGSAEPLSQITSLLQQAYAQAGRYDSAYYFSCRTQALTDSVREARQYAALAATEARFRTREQASQIRLLTRLSQQQTRSARLVGVGALLLALLALGLGLAWRTTRRLNQQLAAQATRLGELDKAKNQFFANVSHELRTPLTLVLGPLDALLTDSTQALSAAVRQPVALAHRQAQRLLQLVNRILDLTKLQAGRLSSHPVPTPLAALLRRVVAQFESLAAQRGLSLPAPAGLPDDSLRVLLDADKLEEILLNLLINALNHTPAGGTVRVTFTLPEPGGEDYAITVADTGVGIAQAEQARVFERFYQSPQAHAQGGTGLGLALSRELALLLGGTLTLVSAPGQGAAFTLRFAAPCLPAEPVQALAEPLLAQGLAESLPAALVPWPVPAGPGPRPRVLVVEDQSDLREYLVSLLAPAYEVLVAADGQAALELLAREGAVDLIATDAMMPRLSGVELLARLRADPARQRVPVLMLTARADEAHRLAALTVGVDDYLTKPFTKAELLARVHALLARQQVRRHFATLPPEELVPEPEPVSPPHPEPVVAAPPVAPAARRKLAPAAVAEQLAQWQAQVVPRLADEHFGPVELAQLLCLGERTLYRRLGELAGLTPAAWLRELRLGQARQLLEAGGFESVAAVADAVGFASPKYFAVLYTERFGRRPSEYAA